MVLASPICRRTPTAAWLAIAAAAVGSATSAPPSAASPSATAGFLAAQSSLAATSSDDSDGTDTDDIRKLRLRLQEERNRAEIADVAAVAALQNATLQAQRRKEAEDKLAQVAPSLGVAQRRAEEEQKRVEALKEELKEAEAREARRNASTPLPAPKVSHHGKLLPDKTSSYPLDGLRSCPGQIVIASVSALLGLLSILDAVGFLKVSVVLLAAGLSASIAAWEAEQQWGDEATALAAGMALEAGIIAGFSALLGIEGLLPSLAALLASMLAARLLALVGDEAIGALGQIAWYGLWCLLGATGVVVADWLRRHEARAVCGALLGGIFAGSGVSCFLATLFGAAGSWWDYFEALLAPALAQGDTFNGFCLDVGVLSGLAVAAASFLRFWLQEPSTDPKYPFPELLELLGLPTGPQPPKRKEPLQQPLLRNVPELPKASSAASSSSSTSGLRPPAGRAEPLPSIPSQGSSPTTAVASQATVTTMASRKSTGPAAMLSGFLKGLVKTLKKAVSTKPPRPNVRLPSTRTSRSSGRGG